MDYTISNQYLTIKIAQTGAELQSILKDGREYLWGGDSQYWQEHAPVLFPYVGRFTDGKYTLGGRAYEMEIHGFARHLIYTVTEQTENRIVFEAADTKETFASYPYHFLLRISYTLQDNKLLIEYAVVNQSDRMMYFGIGGHPGFHVPLEEGLDFSDYYLEFSRKSCPDRVGHTQSCYLNGINQKFTLEDGSRLALHHEMFDEDAIVLQNIADEVTLKSDKGSRQIQISYPKCPYLGLWHAPKTEAPYICIEPWTSLPSRQGIVEEFQNKSDLIRLEAAETYRNTWSIAIQ